MRRNVCAIGVLLMVYYATAGAEITRRQFFDAPYAIEVINEGVMADICEHYWGQVYHVFDNPVGMCSKNYLNDGNAVGDFFVVDKGQCRVRFFGTREYGGIKKLAFMKHIDGGALRFARPEAITFSTLLLGQQRQLFVLDTGNNRLVRVPISYTAFPPTALTPVTIYDSAGGAGPLNSPHDVDFSVFNDPLLASVGMGILVIADTYNHRVVCLKLNGELLWSVGGPEPGGGVNQFSFPYAVTAVSVDEYGGEAFVYVLDRGNGRVVKLRYVAGFAPTWESVRVIAVPTSQVGAGILGLEDIETDDTDLMRNGVFVLDSAGSRVIQLDLDLGTVLQEFGAFGAKGALHDLDVSRGLMGVVRPFTSTSGLEWFEVAADAENVTSEPSIFDAATGFTQLSFTCTSSGAADVWVENGAGQAVKTLWTGYPVNAGQYSLLWNGMNDAGLPVTPGSYSMMVRVDDAYWIHTSPVRTTDVDVLLDPQVRTVDASGGKDFTTIAAALQAAAYGDTLLVYGGTYTESVVMRERVSIVGAEPGVVINSTANSHTVRFVGLQSPGLLENVEITHAAGYFPTGGGVLIDDSSPVLRRCTIRGCVVGTQATGGGIRIVGSSAPYFEDCVFSENSAYDGGAVAIVGFGSDLPAARFESCEFVDNSAGHNGGALFVQYNTFLDTTAVQPTFVGCLFAENEASDGAATWITACARPHFTQCTFVQNHVTSSSAVGGILSGDVSGAVILGSTIAFNTTIAAGGTVVDLFGVAGPPKSIFIENSIIAQNAPLAPAVSAYATRYRLERCDVWGNHASDSGWVTSHGNFSLDPAFCAPPGSLQLYAFSPCGPAVSGGTQVGAFGVACVPDATVGVASQPTPPVGDPDVVFACPAGDAHAVVVTVDFDDATVTREILPHEIWLQTPPPVPTDTLLAFDEDEEGKLLAVSAATGPTFVTTIEHSEFGGHGIDTLAVYLNGVALAASAHVDIRTPDTAQPNGIEQPDGTVGVHDFWYFGFSYQSPPKPYNYVHDFNGDGDVTSTDFAIFGSHYEHSTTHDQLTPSALAVSSDATVSLRFTEEFVTATERRLFADIEMTGIADMAACVLSIQTGISGLGFRDWERGDDSIGQVLFSPAERGGATEMFFGIRVSESFEGTAARIGRLVFDVEADQPLVITEDDFRLTVGDLLITDAGGDLIAARMEGVIGRTLDPNVMRVFHDRLEQNFPNPFNPTTTIAYSLKSAADVSLVVYDVAGRRVRDLISAKRNAGAYRVEWNGRNDNGQPVASGVYFYKLVAGSFVDTKKMTILK